MLSRHSLVIVLATLASSCGGSEAALPRPAIATAQIEDGPLEPSPEGRLPANVRPTRYALALTIDPAQPRFDGVTEIDVTLPEPRRVIYLHARGLEVTHASVTPEGGDPIAARWTEPDPERGVAALVLPVPVGPGAVRVRITYGAPFDQTLEGLYHVEADGEHYAFTQMEPLSARRAFPCFDEPSFKTPFDVTLTVRADHAAIATEVLSEPAADGMRRVRFATSERLPTYLVAFAVGPLDVVEVAPIPGNEVRDRPLPLRGVAARGQGPRLAYALEHTPRMLASLERYFGIPYPYAKLDLIAVPDFAAGAMENAGAITFRDTLLLLADDAPVQQRRSFAYVTAHELAHQWLGNLVTMEWWDDLWLNEAFATWAETRTIQETFPEHAPEVAEITDVLGAMGSDSLASARQIRQPIESDHGVHNAFDSITYSKGAGVARL